MTCLITLPFLVRFHSHLIFTKSAIKVSFVNVFFLPVSSPRLTETRISLPVVPFFLYAILILREYLQTVNLPGMPPSILNLKVGAPIMLLQNLDPSEGLCNGTRLVVRKITKHIIHARILTGDYKGKDCLIPRIKLHPYSYWQL
jgi:hypothetical protein